ncbi:MAG: cysteine desulfurase [Rhodospirillales bacterium]|nr:cysteine desulfurase [Alphaproteobacteria bacterium]USO03416.1 MAG: cysteine desulfurase [Rhodospirillales bacterium]
MMDISIYREDFPILQEKMNGRPLAFLDSAASAQKPRSVMEAMRDLFEHNYANVHRGLYRFSQVTTHQYEAVRSKAADFINAPSGNEIVFTRNSTEGINLVAQSWGRTFLRQGDEIILSGMEHHANIVPWQLLRDQIGIHLRIIPVLGDGTLDLEAFEGLLSDKTRLVSLVHVSNALGTINPVQKMVKTVKNFNPEIKVLLDGSQAVVHGPVDVQALGCDFYVFTGHKLYGPTGAGVLWGRFDLLEAMPPYQGGGDMIETVSFEKTAYKAPPARFEAGTPAIAEVIGLGAAIDYLGAIGMEAIAAHEKGLLAYALQELERIEGLTCYGRAPEKAGIVSFVADWAHPSDIAMILDQCGVAIRTGHHCCMPLMKRLGVEGTARASLGLYTNKNDIDALVAGLKKAKEMLA